MEYHKHAEAMNSPRVKTAFLHAPIDQEIFMDQPEGFAMMSESGERIVYKLRESLYGLKQSGRNWNKVLHEHLVGAGFDRNQVDHCIYSKQHNHCSYLG